MLERYPDEAPPSLVIVVDEFATLVKEVPDFVAGIVDIAQRGRSLGVHLILATQRPSGSVNENILANTNLRISLRMLDSMESKTIIGVGSAADIPLPLKGRGFAKLGPRDLIEFQSAFTGAPLTQENEVIPVIVERVRQHGPASPGRRRPAPAGPRTAVDARTTVGTTRARTLDRTPTAASAALAPPVGLPMPPPLGRTAARPVSLRRRPRAALPPPVASRRRRTRPRHRSARQARRRRPTSTSSSTPFARRCRTCPPPRKPWREMLPEMLPWDTIEPPDHVTERRGRGRYITLGVLDDPGRAGAVPGGVRPRGGWWPAVAGGGGSGKTTALRTVARSPRSTEPPRMRWRCS